MASESFRRVCDQFQTGTTSPSRGPRTGPRNSPRTGPRNSPRTGYRRFQDWLQEVPGLLLIRTEVGYNHGLYHAITHLLPIPLLQANDLRPLRLHPKWLTTKGWNSLVGRHMKRLPKICTSSDLSLSLFTFPGGELRLPTFTIPFAKAHPSEDLAPRLPWHVLTSPATYQSFK